MTLRRPRSIVNLFSKQYKQRQRKHQRQFSRKLLTEQLEDRRLLAGPELMAIRPDEAALLQVGDTLHTAPRTINLLFKGGADLSEASIADNVRLVRSGGDGRFDDGNEVTVALGFVGLNEPGDTSAGNLQRVVLRPASSAAHNATNAAFAFPDDTYQIQILGSSASPLRNRSGEAFNDGQDVAHTFRLDRGAQVVAVVPQPVARNTHRIALTGGASTGAFTLTFLGQTSMPIALPASAMDVQNALQNIPGNVIRPNDVIVSGGGLGPWDVTFQGQYAAEQSPTLMASGGGLNTGGVSVNRLASLSQAKNQIVVYFDDQDLDPADAVDPKFYRLFNTQASLGNADDAMLLPQQVVYDEAANRAALTFASIPDGTYRLEVGVSDEVSNTIADALKVGTLFSKTGVDFEYVGFVGDQNGASDDQADVDYYQINVAAGATLDIRVASKVADFDPSIRLLTTNGTPVTPDTFTEGGDGGQDTQVFNSIAGSGFVDLIVEVSSEGGTGGTGGYLLQMDVTGSTISASDANTTFAGATQLGSLGQAGVSHTALIQTQGIGLPEFPGSVDEPGHRDIQGEQHVSDDIGITNFRESVTPNGIRQIRYYFGSIYGTDSFGNNLTNQITEGQKQLARQIFEIYSSQLGIQFVELTTDPGAGSSNDLQVVTGSIAAVTNAVVPGTHGYTKRLSHLVSLMDASQFSSDDKYGGPWFAEAVRQIGQAIGGDATPWLVHSYDLLSSQGPGLSVAANSARFPGDPAYAGPVGEPVFPGDHDLVHKRREARPDSTDIDMYRFKLDHSGLFVGEISAQRTGSLLNSVLTLFDVNGSVIAQNDDYFSKDSYLELELEPGTYFVGVTSVGNASYNPHVPDSGFGGTSDGEYQLNLSFQSTAVSHLRDTTGVNFDGDADGTPGGIFQFWFESSDDTIFVDKANDQRANLVDGDGMLTGPTSDPTRGPYDNLEFALRQAENRIVAPLPSAIQDGEKFDVTANNVVVTFEFNKVGGLPTNGVDISTATTADDIAEAIRDALDDHPALSGMTVVRRGNVVMLDGIQSLNVKQSHGLLTSPNLVRIVGNGGLDMDISTLGDNAPYLLGLDNSNNPTADGAEFLVPQGTTVMVDSGALFKMRRANLTAGSSSTGIDRSAGAIQVLGVPGRPVYFRSLRDDTVGGDSDGIGPAATGGDYGGIVFRADSDLEDDGVFLNWVNHADLNRGGGKVPVESREEVFAPIHMADARPTVSFNRITQSAGAALSADLNSFADEGGRIGPDIHSNTLFAIDPTSGTVLDNSINGLFIRIETLAGNPVDKLTTTARFDDQDIVHVITENLLIAGNPGGTLGGAARLSGRLRVDAGVVVKLDDARIELERGASSLIAEGTVNDPVIFTSVKDDRFGGSGIFDTDRGTTSAKQGDWGGLIFNAVSSASIDHALITFAGGQTPLEGNFSVFNAIEVHQARLRLTNSILEKNASGRAADDRNGRGTNKDAVIFVRGAQPIIVNNIIRNNNLDRLGGAAPTNVISINANALNSDSLQDYGRSTGLSERFDQIANNHGPLVRLNRIANNGTNGMDVRGAYLTTESVWDDTDIVHVAREEIMVGNHHTFSGLRLQSSNTESLVVKFSGANAGFTATGRELDIDDRIGGTVQVLGTPGHPVILTSLADDTTGSGFSPTGSPVLDTNNDGIFGVDAGAASPAPGNWRSVRLDKLSNDRNVGVTNELENPLTNANDTNARTSSAEQLGQLAPNQKSGDENRRLGFEVHGIISPDDPADDDIYSFQAEGGTRVWLDLDRTASDLDARLELIDINGTVVATSSSRTVLSGTAQTMRQNTLLGGDYYSLNPNDPGMSVVLSGTGTGTYFVRVRADGPTIVDSNTLSVQFLNNDPAPSSITISSGDFLVQGFAAGQRLAVRGSGRNNGDYLISTVTANTITLDVNERLITESAPTGTKVRSNLTSGAYQLQVRLQQRDEKPGSAIRYADIRYATTGIEVRGLPYHSNLLGEVAEVDGGDVGDTSGSAFNIGNVLATDRAAISIGGEITTQTDVDWYEFTLDHALVENATENSSGLKTVALVFDIDYADGLSRPDTTLAIYDGANRLIYIGRESNVADDQDTTVGDASADLSRGSAGKLDPYIGPIHLPVGFVNGVSRTYRMAIMSNRNAPNAIMGFYLANGGQADLRLEPANGVQRIVEDHIGTPGGFFFGDASSGYISGTFTRDTISAIEDRFEVSPQHRTVSPTVSRIFDTSNVTSLTTSVKPFTLADVRLYVSTEEDLFSVDPFNGNDRVRVGSAPAELQDIVFRSDGRLYGYQRRDVDQTDGDGPFGNEVANTAGELVELSAGDGSILGRTDDGIRGPILATNNPVVQDNYRHDITYTDQVDAVTFRRTPLTSSLPQAPQYDIYYSVRDPNVPFGGASKLFLDDSPTGVADGVVPDVTAGNTTNNNGGLIGYIGATKSFAFVTMNNAVIGFFPNDVGPAGDGIMVNVTQSAADPGTNPVVVATCSPTTINVTIRNNAGNTAASAQTVVDVINAACDGSPGFAAVMDGDGGNNVANTTTTIVGDRVMTTAGGTRTLRGITTGLAFVDTDADGDGDNLFGVTNQGEFFRINTLTPTNTFFPTASVTILADLGAGVNFQGLATGPQNLRDLSGANPGFYRQMVFAIDSNGTLRAFDTTKAALAPNVPLESIFSGGTTRSVSISPLSGGVTGLAFSPLDFNLWHPTQKRGNDPGHGLNPSVDNERNPGLRVVNFGPNATTDAQGNRSFHFALEQFDEDHTAGDFKYQRYGGAGQGSTAQLGIGTNLYHNDLTSTAAIGDNYNLPGGALGSLVSGTFSLANYSKEDSPTLYFNYWLQSQDAAAGPHEYNPGAVFPQDRSMRDSARVFISNDGNTWEMLATNNSTLSLEQKNGDDEAELSSFISHNSTANFTGGNTTADGRRIVEQQVQELFDLSDWRQARVDLQKYAGLSTLRLRFDFSTAGSMDQNMPGDEFGAFEDSVTTNDTTARERGQNNAFEGFYIDDIIVGLAERGEMVTGAAADSTIFDLESNGRTRFADPTAPTRHLTGNYQVEIRRAGEYASILTGLRDDLIMKNGFPYDSNDRFVMETGTRQAPGDRNVERQQGQLIIDSNVITNSQTYGIDVSAGSRNPAGNRPRPGSLIRFDKENTNLLYPGAVIQNNIVAFGGQGGIRFAGDAGSPDNAPVPFGKIVNNTIYGGNARTGTGISVESNASPTLLNNIIANTNTAIQAAGTSPVIGSNLFHNNTTPTQPTDLLAGSNPLFQLAGDPLFVNTLTKNFYLQAGALAIDSSLDSLQDRLTFASFKAELGIPQSPIFAPSRDVFGQLRVDDPNEDPLGGGASIFKDRGAVDRADKEQPFATLILPIDNDTEGLDLDKSSTIVRRTNVFLEFFSILLGDGLGPNSPFQGTGVNGLTVSDPADPLVSQRAVKLSRNGVPLVEGVDYNLGYNANSGVLLLTPLSLLWEPQSVYLITLDNTQIADLAGNRLRNNQPGGETTFTIFLGNFDFDYGDAPNSYGTLQASNGARHVLIQDDPTTPANESIYLGSGVDGDADGAPTTLADGDDSEQAVGLGTSTLTLVSQPPFQVQLPANGTGLNDNDSFIVSDGINSVTFQFDLGDNGGVGGNVAIPYFNLDRTTLLADRVVRAIRQQVTAGALVGISATAQGAGIIAVAGGAGANVNVLGAGGRISISNRLPIALKVPTMGLGQIADQMTFTVNDGVNPPVTFEFDSSLAVGLSNPANIPISFNGAVYNANDIAAALAAAINAQAGPGKPLSNLNNTAASVLVTSADTVAIVNKSNNVEDDEDGITLGKIFVPVEADPAYVIPLEVIASTAGFLDAWIDFNRNGLFTEEEHLFGGSLAVTAGSNLLSIRPSDYTANVAFVPGDTYARFRISPLGGLFPTGLGIGGEVEDYLVRILSNTAPSIANPVANIMVLEDADDTEIDLKSVFNDVDIANGNGDFLTYRFADNTTSMTFRDTTTSLLLVTATINAQGKLVLDYVANRNGQTVVSVKARDHAGLEQLHTFTVTVTAVNDAPIVTVPGPQVFNEGGLSTAPLASYRITGISVVDVDAAEIGGGPIVVTLSIPPGTGTLSVNPGVVGGVAPANNNSVMVTLTGTVAQINATLANATGVTYTVPSNDFNNNTNGGDVILNVMANDQGNTGAGGPLTDSKNIAITITPINDAPVLDNSGAMTLTPITEDDLTDLTNAGTLIADIIASSTVPSGNAITDVDENSVEGIAIIGLLGRNANGWQFRLAGDPNFQPVGSVSNTAARLLPATATLRYIPDGLNGETASVTFRAWDTTSGTAGELGNASVNGGSTSFSTTVQAVTILVEDRNDPPVANDDNYTVAEDVVLSVSSGQGVLLNDTDVDLPPQTLTVVDPHLITLSDRGAPLVVNANGSFTYNPAQVPVLRALAVGQTLQDFFRYRIQDNGTNLDNLVSNEATVTITVLGRNDAPVAVNDSYATNEDTPLSVSASQGLLINDTDAEGDALSVSRVDGLAGNIGLAFILPSGATLLVTSSGGFEYDPRTSATLNQLPQGALFIDTFTYHPFDGLDHAVNPGTVSITVTGVNDPPVANDDNYATNENTVLTVPAATGLFANDFDPDAGDVISLRTFSQTSNLGASVVVNADGGFTYDPRVSSQLQQLSVGQVATDRFTYQIVDSFGLTDTATVTITVQGLNDPPVAVNDSDRTDENSILVVAAPGVMGNDVEIDANDVIQVVSFDAVSVFGAQITVAPDGGYTYDPTQVPALQALRVDSPPVVDTFRYTIRDSQGATDTATVTITVTGLNDPPVARPNFASTPEDDLLVVPAPGVLVNDSDPDEGETETLTVIPGNFTSTLGAAVTIGSTGQGGYTYDPRNAPQLQALQQGTSIVDTFTYTVRDIHGASSVGVVSVTVFGVNDPPVANPDFYETSEGVLLTIGPPGLLLNDTDVDGDPLSVIAFDGVSARGAALSIQSHGGFTYDPRGVQQLQALGQGETLDDTFLYTIIDENGVFASSTATIRVHGENDPPVAVNDSYRTDEDSILVVSGAGVLANDFDIDANDVLTVGTFDAVSALGVPVGMNPDGTFTYDPTNVLVLQQLNIGQTRTDTFTYLATDGIALSDPATVTITVDGRNDPPIVQNNTYSVDEDQQLIVSVAQGALSNDTDLEGSPLTASLVTPPLNGVVVLNSSGSFIYTPNKDFNGADTFRYAANDGALSTVGTVTINVNPVNDPPVAVPNIYSVNEDAVLVVSAADGVLANDFDVDQDPLRAIRVAGSGPTNGTLNLSLDGSFIYTANPGFFGTDSFRYFAQDPAGANSNTVTVTLNVLNTRPLRNTANPLDVNNDGVVSAIDVLLIINEINKNGAHEIPASTAAIAPFWDVNGDGFVSSIDVLIVVNFLNSRGSGEGEHATANSGATLTSEHAGLAEGESSAITILPHVDPMFWQRNIISPQRRAEVRREIPLATTASPADMAFATVRSPESANQRQSELSDTAIDMGDLLDRIAADRFGGDLTHDAFDVALGDLFGDE